MAQTLAGGLTRRTAATSPPGDARPDSALRRYGFAVLAIFVAAVATVAIRGVAHATHPIAAFQAAILLTGWYAGAGPTVLALVLCVLVDWWIPTVFPPRAEALLGLRFLWFLFFAVAAGYFGVVRRRMTLRLEAARDRLEEQVADRTAQLRRSQFYLADAQRLAHTGCWAMSLASPGGTYWSDELYRILGYDPASIPPDMDRIESSVFPQDREALTVAVRERREFELDCRIMRQDGIVRHLHMLGRPYVDATGTATEYLGVVVDQTDLREGERKLAEAERLAHLAYWEVAAPANDVSWTEEGRRILGLDAGERSRTWNRFMELVHRDDRALVENVLARAMGGESSFAVAYRIVRPSGECRYVEKIVDVERDPSGRPIRAIGALQDVTERRQAEAALRDARDQLQHLSRRLLEVQEEERRHLGRELHDEFGQLLASIGLHLHAARTLEGQALRSRLDESMALLQRAGDEVRSLALELRPALLETAGLDATLRWLAEQQQQATGITIEVQGHLGDVADDAAIVAFRVAQEALTNVARHARADHVWIELSRNEDVLEMVIRDNGIGFDVDATIRESALGGRLGLLGMKERLELVGGTLVVEASHGHGTTLRASIPVPPESAERPRRDAGGPC